MTHKCQCENTENAENTGIGKEEIISFFDECEISPHSHLIGVLQQTQGRFGYLPAEALIETGRRMKLPLSRIYGVVSFYSQFHTSPRGKHTIQCCRGTACYVRGGKQVIDAVRERLDIEDNQTSDDMMFSFETVACLGTCALAPVVVIDGEYHGKVTSSKMKELIDEIAEAEMKNEESE